MTGPFGQVINGRGALQREPQRLRDEDVARRAFSTVAARLAFPSSYGSTIMRPTDPILSQPAFPDCAGVGGAALLNWRLEAAGCIDPVTRQPLRASGVSLWRDARRRRWGWRGMQDIESGSYIRDVFESICVRGFDPWRQGEDTDPEEAGQGAPHAGDDLADELAAHDNRMPNAERYRFSESSYDICDAVEVALGNPDVEIEFGGGCRDDFFALRPHPDQPDVLVTSALRGGDKNGHAERIFGVHRVNGERRWYGQGSWTERFAGCHAPDGTFLRGCWVGDDSVLREAWDIHCLVVDHL